MSIESMEVLFRQKERKYIIKTLEGLMKFRTNTPQRIQHRLALEVMIGKLKEELIKGEK